MKLFVAQKSSSGGLFHSPPPLTYSVWNSRGGRVCVWGEGGRGGNESWDSGDRANANVICKSTVSTVVSSSSTLTV